MFNCKIYHSNESGCIFVLLDKDYQSLTEMSIDLGMSYQQVADLSSRKEKKKYQKFKYFPNIDITKKSQKLPIPSRGVAIKE